MELPKTIMAPRCEFCRWWNKRAGYQRKTETGMCTILSDCALEVQDDVHIRGVEDTPQVYTMPEFGCTLWEQREGKNE